MSFCMFPLSLVLSFFAAKAEKEKKKNKTAHQLCGGMWRAPATERQAGPLCRLLTAIPDTQKDFPQGIS